MFRESLHAQSRKVERKPCGTAAISQSLSRSNSTADARSACPRGREPGQGAFADQLPLELGQRREDAEHEAAGGGGVDLRALVLRVPAVVISFGIGGGVLSARWLVGDSVRVADEVEHGLP